MKMTNADEESKTTRSNTEVTEMLQQEYNKPLPVPYVAVRLIGL